MTTVTPEHFRIRFAPRAKPEAIVIHGRARFTMLTSRLVRLEFSPSERFEDRPSQVFWFRDQPLPAYERHHSATGLTIETEHLRLEYRPSGAGFRPDNLSILVKETGSAWQPGKDDPANLGGTIRTLDMRAGPVPLPDGLMSRSGWGLLDDTSSPVFVDEAWLEARQREAGARDLYFFGYGQDYRACLQDYCRVTGRVPLLPRWALGNWWSRYWAYSGDELLKLMRQFRARDIPLSVCIVDMDWHLVDIGEGISGWTGYTWNRELFPEPEVFLKSLHDLGLKTALNLHPAEGVRPHEAMYAEMARRMDLDPATGAPIPFDITDPTFARTYFEVLHHPQEEAGVDFWWIDWQQGTESGIPGCDPLWWLNHLHAYDRCRDGTKRPFIFSRYGGPGNHRYPIGFSGDTHVTWESLAFQPYLTATAANVGYGWWSHDIGGHMFGTEDRELFTRWVQFGVFSPIFRLHSTNNPFHERRPWGYDAEVEEATVAAMRLRHRLIPYLYSMAWRNHLAGQTLVEPMNYQYPTQEEAYSCPQQYRFGTELVVAPHTVPRGKDTRLSRQLVWLPAGDWYDFFTGQHYQGATWQCVYGRLDQVPVFARAGAIVPLDGLLSWGHTGNPEEIEVWAFAGADNRFELYEDDGDSLAYESGEYVTTIIEQRLQPGRLTLTVTPPSKNNGLIPRNRRYRFRVYGLVRPGECQATVAGQPTACTWKYDVEAEMLEVKLPSPTGRDGLVLTILADNSGLLSRRDRTRETYEAMLAAFHLPTLTKWGLLQSAVEILEDPMILAKHAADCTTPQLRALAETITQSGAAVIRHAKADDMIVLWNNDGSELTRFNYAELHRGTWDLAKRHRQLGGVVPAFQLLEPTGQWKLQVSYGDWLTTAESN